MKKAFRIMGLCALVAIAATSCKKEAQTTSSFKATLTQPTSEAKTHLGSDSYLYWNEGDAIKVFDAQGNEYQFSTDDNNVTTATFNGTDPIDVNGSYTAFYPAANVEKVSNDILLTLPATQDYAEGTFGNATYPMAALYNATDGFTFGSDCGLLALQVKGTGNIGSIELTGKNSENLAGQLRYDLNGTYQGLTNAQTKVTLNCGNLELDATNATTFYFALPAGVFTGGFTAVLKNGNTELYTLETTNNNAIAKDTIMVMPVVTVQAIGVTTGDATGISKTAATLNGSYELPTTAQGMNVTEVGFYFGTDASAMTATQATLGTPFSLAKEGLTEGTTYYYKAYAKNGTHEYEGEVKNFTTLAAPAATTGTTGHEEPTISSTTAVCYGELASLSGITEYGICWSTENFSFSKDASVTYVASTNWEGGVFSATIPVAANGTYYYCAYAINAVGTGYGEIKTFTVTWNGNLAELTGSEPAGYATATNGMTIYGTLNAKVKVSIADGATVTLNNAIISYSSNGADYAGLTLIGDGTLVLADGTTNTVFGGLAGNGDSNWPGIYVPEGKTLTINGNTGVLNAAPGVIDDYGSPAGIGCGWDTNCGDIVINGGVINANGGAKSAGIGGCFRRICGDITINGGTITATAGYRAAGIGTGGNRTASTTTISPAAVCGNITINDGTVIAIGGQYGAGIGNGGADGSSNSNPVSGTCGNILITGGTVTATGGQYAAAIGNGYTPTTYSTNTCGTITITDGVTLVTATHGSSATYSIGCGRNPSDGTNTCGTITIGGTEYPSGATPNQSDGSFVYPAPPTAPAGAINGLFSVSATQQVWFSQGNLLNTGYFEDNQYAYGGLLQWAASFTTNYSGDWRALTSDEWNYLLTDRANASNLWGFANVEYSNVEYSNGIILLPDGSSLSINTDHSAWDNNSIDNTTWSDMEANGAVFLPAAGYLDGSSPEDNGKKGYYWCSTSGGYMSFGKSGSSFEAPTYNVGGGGRRSVRLVINVQ